MQAQRSQGLDTIIGKVNSVLWREITLPCTEIDPMTHARKTVRYPAAAVYTPQPNRPATVAIETPWGYFLPIGRAPVDGVSVNSREDHVRKERPPDFGSVCPYPSSLRQVATAPCSCGCPRPALTRRISSMR